MDNLIFSEYIHMYFLTIAYFIYVLHLLAIKFKLIIRHLFPFYFIIFILHKLNFFMVNLKMAINILYNT